MCGIVGTLRAELGDELTLERWVQAQLAAVEHRGGDQRAVFLDPPIGLGITRLSIVDVAGGDQPIRSPDGRHVIVYNGEVYNHGELRDELERRGWAFRTRTDTEVVLATYVLGGAAALSRLNGMFAFAIWDRRERELVLVRDRFGIKPLVYASGSGLFAFASEVKGILALPGLRREIDPVALRVFLAMNYLPAPLTLVDGIRQLEPGHLLRVRPGGDERLERWHQDPPRRSLDLSEGEIDERFRALFHAAVDRQFASEVPVGISLSGGLDSTAICAALAARGTRQLRTFTVAFAEPSFDESERAAEVSRRFGAEHRVIRPGPREYFDAFRSFVASQDNPVADQATVPVFLLSKLARETVKVCLFGDGADELLGGYVTVLADRLQPLASRVPSALLTWAERAVAHLPDRGGRLPLRYRARSFLRGSRLSREEAHAGWRLIHDGDEVRRLLGPALVTNEAFAAPSPYQAAFRDAGGGDFFDRAEAADLRVWLAGNNLAKVDSMTMAASLEGRVPYLDHELAEFLRALPFDRKVVRWRPKAVLKRYLLNAGFSRAFVHRQKGAFLSPIAEWYRGPLRGALETLFREERGLYDAGLLAARAPLELLDEHVRGRQDNAFKLFGLSLLTVWYAEVFRANWAEPSRGPAPVVR